MVVLVAVFLGMYLGYSVGKQVGYDRGMDDACKIGRSLDRQGELENEEG